MSEWKEYGLNEIASFSQGKQIPVSEQFENKLLELDRFIRIVDFTSDWTQPPRYVKKDDKYKVGKNDIVMLRYGTPGKVFRGHEGIIANNMFKISPDESIVTKEYLYWFLYQDSVYKILMANQSSSTMPAISFKMLSCINVKVPSFETQQHISSFFDTLDEKIAVNKKICENLEAQAQALFKHWFVDFAPFKDGKFVESELGLIPEGWRVGTLTEIAEYLNGLAMQKFPPLSDDDSIPVLKIKELGQSQCDNSSDKCSKQIKPEYIVKNGVVVFSWSGTLMVDIWCGGICGLNQHLFKVTSDNYPKWFYLMWTKHHLAEFIRIAKDKAVTMGHIKRGDLEKAQVAIPDSNTLDKMSEVMNVIFDQIINSRLESNALSTLRDTLLPRLMSGELKINEFTNL